MDSGQESVVRSQLDRTYLWFGGWRSFDLFLRILYRFAEGDYGGDVGGFEAVLAVEAPKRR